MSQVLRRFTRFSGHVGPVAGSLLSASVKPAWDCQGSGAFRFFL